MKTTWDNYRKWLGNILVGDFPSTPPPHPRDIATDSRSIVPGQYYLPLIGVNFDGHSFIHKAIKNGAVGNFTQDSKQPGILVTDTMAALSAIAKGWRNENKTKIVAITGSVGKTTCKELLTCILTHDSDQNNKVLATKGNQNNEIGVPLTLLGLQEDHDFAVIECGARHVGDIRHLVEIVAPDSTICLNATESHMEPFGSHEALVNTKTEIFRFSPANCQNIAPSDDGKILQIAKQTLKKVVTFGYSESADVSIKSETWNDGRLTITLSLLGFPIDWKPHFSHQALAINAAAACAAAISLGISPTKIKNSLDFYRPVSGRFSIIRENNPILVDDAYNASPKSMKAGLLTLSNRYPNLSQSLILGEMLELGTESKSLHYEIGEFCGNQIEPEILITVGELAQHIGQGAMAAGIPSDRIFHCKNSKELTSEIWDKLLKSSNVIYAKGSNSVKLSEAVSRLNSYINDSL